MNLREGISIEATRENRPDHPDRIDLLITTAETRLEAIAQHDPIRPANKGSEVCIIGSMHDRSVLWPSAAAAFVGSYLAMGVLAAVLYFSGQFECGRHVGVAVEVPVWTCLALAAIASIAASLRFAGSVLLTVVFDAPILLVSSVALLLAAMPDNCASYTIGLRWP